MTKQVDQVTGRIALGVAGCLMFGAYLAVWQRALDTVAGKTEATLAAFAGVSALGLAVGLAAAWWPCRKSREPVVFLRTLFLLLACWLAFQLAAVTGVAAGWQRILMDTTRTFGLALQTLAKTAALWFGVPAVLAGMAWQVLLQQHSRSAARPARAFLLGFIGLGFGAAWAGYWLGSVVLIPLAGVEGFTRLAILWFGALASLAVLAGGVPWTGLRLIAACAPLAAVVGVMIALLPHGKGTVLSEGMFGRLVHRDSGFAQGIPMFEHHAGSHTITAYDDPDYQFVFALDGRPMLFGNRFHTARTLCGTIPLLVRPASKRAAVLGAEAGFYLPFLSRGGVQDLSYDGCEPSVLKLTLAADGFVAGDKTAEQATLRKGVTLSSRGAYDILFLAGEPVWTRGSRSSYSRAFFGQCRRSLSTDGIVALHLDARALSPGRFVSIAKAFAAEFPGMQVWCTGAYDWLLVGCAKEIKVPVDSMLGMAEKPLVFRDLARGGIQSLPDVLACMVCDGKGLAPWLESTPSEAAWCSAWRAPLLAFATDRAILQPVALEGCRQWKAQWVLPGELDVDVYVALLDKVGRSVGARVSAVTALAETAKGRGDAGLEAARAAAQVNPRDALLIHLTETVELEARRRIKIGDFKGGAKCYENLLSFGAEKARSHYGLAYCLRANGENEASYLHFARAVAAAPEQTGYRLELAQVALTIGEFAEADRQYQESLKREPDNPEFLFRYAKGLSWKERPQKDMAQALKLAEKACVLTQWGNKEYTYGLADLYMEAGRVLEGMGLKRRIKEGFSK